MSNTPWHHEVVQFTARLKEELDKLRAIRGEARVPRYGLACEHRHSCSVLLAREDQFLLATENETDAAGEEKKSAAASERRWHTWIDYEKFHALAMRRHAEPGFQFGVMDYTAEAPAWSVFGAEEEGFDPTDRRFFRKSKVPMYTKFREDGVPTHDWEGKALEEEEMRRLVKQMEEAVREAGGGDEASEVRKREEVQVIDPKLMFRGLTVVKKGA
uniref:tRNA wybutosine-synthesis domain-containing protein n=1 Tax=Corethron hystrix TaxID=216773 RepID=A0A7S1B438_9STRA